VHAGLDYVDAQLKRANTPLPRIPPLRGRLGLDFRSGGFSFRPEIVMANRQNDIFPTETRTAGYAVVNLAASYTLAQQHFVHLFGFQVFNAGDTLYRNHLSFIKELAPEIGRGVRLVYTVRFF
jgi:iron complex outermembrane receptor protein